MGDPIDTSAVEVDTPGAVSGGVNTDAPPIEQSAPIPVTEPDPKGVDWHTPDGASGYSWGELQQMAHTLSESRLVPDVFRRQPANIVAIALTGQELGWGVATAMRFIQVIDGKPTVSPEGMLALVRRAGHSVNGKSSSTYATVWGRRRDSGDEMEVTFTMEDATRARLTGKNNWQTFPEAMLWARALAMLCRRLFSDVLIGTAYTPDEMGGETNERGEWIPANSREDPPATITPDWTRLKWRDEAQYNAAREDTKRMLNMLPEDVKARVRQEAGRPPDPVDFSLNIWSVRHKMVVDAAKELGLEAAFKDTTPNMTALDPETEPTDIDDNARPEPPANVAGDSASLADADVDDDREPGTIVPPLGELTAEDDDADDAWVREALAADDKTTSVSDALPEEPT